MISIQRIQARDRRSAAIHESGHAIVAEHLDYKAYARIFPNAGALTQDPITDNTWLGSTSYGHPIHPENGGFEIGVAGGIAEYLWSCRNEKDPLATLEWDDNAYTIFEEYMSPSDKRTAGLEENYYDDMEKRDEIEKKILEVAKLVADFWLDILEFSRVLIDSSKKRTK